MKRAIITGASTGIGNALAFELAKRGYALALLARREDLLDRLNRQLTDKGAQVFTAVCDVADGDAVATTVARAQEVLGGPFDLAIANAGVSIPGHATKFNLADAVHTIRVNVLGVMNLLDAVIPPMVERRSGRFVGIASIAGLRGLPTAAPYSASKAALHAFLEASRIELAPYGVGVTIVNPGFIATPMTEKNRFKMPFLMGAEESAVVIADGIERGARLVEFPKPMSLLMRFMRLVPDALYERIMVPYGRRKIDPGKVKR